MFATSPNGRTEDRSVCSLHLHRVINNLPIGQHFILQSAAVAVVRSGNERAVNRCKMSRFIRHGNVDGLYDIDFCCDIWEAFT